MTRTTSGGNAAQVTLRPMTDGEYATWYDEAERAYAEEIAGANRQPVESSMERATSQFAELLPQGPHTPGVWLLTVVEGETGDGRPVGVLWLGPDRQNAAAVFIFNVEIIESARGRGLGRATMLAAERFAADLGRKAIALNVFGPNARARALYDSLGYEVVATSMRKELPG